MRTKGHAGDEAIELGAVVEPVGRHTVDVPQCCVDQLHRAEHSKEHGVATVAGRR